jgi:hypothetical protein
LMGLTCVHVSSPPNFQVSEVDEGKIVFGDLENSRPHRFDI